MHLDRLGDPTQVIRCSEQVIHQMNRIACLIENCNNAVVQKDCNYDTQFSWTGTGTHSCWMSPVVHCQVWTKVVEPRARSRHWSEQRLLEASKFAVNILTAVVDSSAVVSGCQGINKLYLRRHGLLTLIPRLLEEAIETLPKFHCDAISKQRMVWMCRLLKRSVTYAGLEPASKQKPLSAYWIEVGVWRLITQ